MTIDISHHVGLEHNFDINMIKFAALEHVSTHVRGGGIDRALLQLETRWNHIHNATRYPGLDEYIGFKSFL